jgi:hypothetical protein
MIKSVRVLSSKGNSSSEIVCSEDKLFLFSASELGYTVTTTPYVQEIEEGAETIVLPIFTDNASRVKKRFNGTGSADNWWLRSPHSSLRNSVHSVQSTGVIAQITTHSSYAISFGFCI